MRFLIFLCATVLISCADSKHAINSDLKTDNRVYKVILDTEYDMISDPFSIDQLMAEGSVIAITVSYNGGCRPHGFQLFTDGELMKSDLSEMNFFLRHDAAGESCDQLIKETLRFDLIEVMIPGQFLKLNLQGVDKELIMRE